MGSTMKTYPTILPIRVHNPKSSGLSFLVTIITKMVPVITPMMETAKAMSPEYVTRMLLNNYVLKPIYN